jgi:23S rRNA (cytosine1962-C5)-methyltransferase
MTPSSELARILTAALDRRSALLAAADTNVIRLFNGVADGIAGLVVEQYGPVLVVQCHAERLTLSDDIVRELCGQALERVGAAAVYRKQFPKDRSSLNRALERMHRDPQPWLGTPAPTEIEVHEAGARFLVRPYDGYATGLYLAHRSARQFVRANCAGRRVLNTFAYTCGFTVAAALGGAASTVSVDISKKSLEWGKRNLAANGLALDAHQFICSDVFEYYRRALRQGRRFDWIILDPPTFARPRRARGTFAVATDLPRLVGGALDLLDRGGTLLLSVNYRGLTATRLERVAMTASRANHRACEFLPPPPIPEDFRGDPDFAKTIVVRVR